MNVNHVNNNKISLEKLPRDIIEQMSDFLSNTDTMAISATSKKFNWMRRTSKMRFELSVVENSSLVDRHNKIFGQAQVCLYEKRRAVYHMPYLGNIHTLEIINRHINIDSSILGDVYCLHIIDCDIKDVSPLDTVHTLNLSICPSVQDVSALGTVHTLNLSMCPSVQDVSALGGVHTLNLSDCPLVRDVSALGNIYDLNLSNCDISDVSALGTVHTLNLYNCLSVQDVSALGGVHTLNLTYCLSIRDV